MPYESKQSVKEKSKLIDITRVVTVSLFDFISLFHNIQNMFDFRSSVVCHKVGVKKYF